MTTYDYRTSTPSPTGTDGGAQGAEGAKEQAKQAAATAADEGKHVADVAKDEAKSVAQDAQQQVRNVLDDARSQIDEQSRSQLDNLVRTLQGFADDLERMARGEGAGSGLARDVVDQVGDKARSLSAELRGREPSELLDQARDFARRRPGVFLAGALGAGIIAGRLARGAKDAGSSSGASSGTSGTTGVTGPTGVPPAAGTDPTGPLAGTASGDPLAGTAMPRETPVYPEGTGNGPGGTL